MASARRQQQHTPAANKLCPKGAYTCERSEGYCVELISPKDVENAVVKTLSKTEAV